MFSPLWLIAQKQRESWESGAYFSRYSRSVLVGLGYCSFWVFAEAIISVLFRHSRGVPCVFPPSERRRDAGEAAHALPSAEVRETRTKPVTSRAGLASPMGAIELTLTCLAQERRIGLLICLAGESRALQSFPLVIRSAGRASLILHNQCFRSTKTTFFVACRDRLSHKQQ